MVTAGAAVWSLISALVAGVVAVIALIPLCETPCLAANGALPFIKDPAGEEWLTVNEQTQLYKIHIYRVTLLYLL